QNLRKRKPHVASVLENVEETVVRVRKIFRRSDVTPSGNFESFRAVEDIPNVQPGISRDTEILDVRVRHIDSRAPRIFFFRNQIDICNESISRAVGNVRNRRILENAQVTEVA